MDINDLRSLITVAGLLCFLAIVVWAYGKSSKKGFEEAANLPFIEADDAPPVKAPARAERDNK